MPGFNPVKFPTDPTFNSVNVTDFLTVGGLLNGVGGGYFPTFTVGSPDNGVILTSPIYSGAVHFDKTSGIGGGPAGIVAGDISFTSLNGGAPFALPQFTLGTLPDATASLGSVICVTDGGGTDTPVTAFSDGANWLPFLTGVPL